MSGDDSLAHSIVEWCREVAARCRRPWGIDYFDLALAAHDTNGGVRSHRVLRLRPMDFYNETILRHLASVLPHRRAESDSSPLRIAVALFSWGDAAHHALPS
jgi:hypothetical protein